ncbi:TRAP transporter substrate-binding protein [Chelatococcus sp. GCM10030263]|uniref:TRAP transporter substrate-binding protein n=1 Tax=Chelatococcus sp. GCM10030263 TaxID=3273387 RepID=UPI003619A5DE
MRTTRRSVLVGTAAAGFGLFSIRPSHAAPEITLRLSNNVSADHPLSVRANQAAKRIAAETDGRVELKVFINSQLGADTDVLSQVRSGAIDFQMISGEVLSTMVPTAGMYAMGFAFPNYDKVWSAMDGDLGSYIRRQIEAAGLYVMTRMWDNGFRQITSSSKEIKTPEDLRGFKIRVPVSPIYTSLFQALGASPVGLNFSELYSALQTGVVDGQENPLVVIQTARLYEVQKYCALTNHLWGGTWFIGNRARMEKLPPNLRDIVTKHINEAALDERADIAQTAAKVRADLSAKGMTISEPNLEPFKAMLNGSGFYAGWQKRVGDEAWALLEKYVGPLG